MRMYPSIPYQSQSASGLADAYPYDAPDAILDIPPSRPRSNYDTNIAAAAPPTALSEHAKKQTAPNYYYYSNHRRDPSSAASSTTDDTLGAFIGVCICLFMLVLLYFALSYPTNQYYRAHYPNHRPPMYTMPQAPYYPSSMDYRPY